MTDNQKWIAIIGASRGIGLSAVALLSRRGYRVIGTARCKDGEDAIAQAGGVPVVMDMRSLASITAGADTIMELTKGRLDALVLNAGVGQPGAVEDVPISAWRDTFEVNLFGPLTVLQALTPSLRQASDARVIWVGSVLGMMGLGYRGPYVATKFAMEGVADVLRIELREAGIQVSLVQPGPVATDFRKTARDRFNKVDHVHSFHANRYKHFLKRLETPDVAGGGTVPAHAVALAISSAIGDRHPRARYRVCGSTSWVEAMRRLLSRNLITWVGMKAFKQETESI